MNIPKVYLAKSNRANPEVVTRVRQILNQFNLQTVEFKGGQYSHKDLLECEYMVVVPDLSKEDEYIIGKGLFEQIGAFKYRKGYESICVISDEDINVKDINEVEAFDSDDSYVEYGAIYFDYGKGCPLDKVLEDMCLTRIPNQGYTNTSIASEYEYILTRKS